ncbi:hypothetical protein [Achromobacter spanius]|uniref:Helix-turn-helix domain-containing protein n=1 Tax=Achromobacter spanius TaxID=217203 RepID=A0A2S0IDT0_9BURK|nr:hypothetical protein [Achromobacter spanius]AVJ30190.1 hypothetical protein CLM73_25525 [Achromobacter spanius]
MNGIAFMVRDRAGWHPPVPPPPPYLHPEFETPVPPPKGQPLTDEHVDYINAMRGFVSVYVLADQFQVSRGTISNIWKGLPNAGRAINHQSPDRLRAA